MASKKMTNRKRGFSCCVDRQRAPKTQLEIGREEAPDDGGTILMKTRSWRSEVKPNDDFAMLAELKTRGNEDGEREKELGIS